MKEAIIFAVAYLLGSWNEKTRTKAIIYELSKLLKKNKVKTDIQSVELEEDVEG